LTLPQWEIGSAVRIEEPRTAEFVVASTTRSSPRKKIRPQLSGASDIHCESERYLLGETSKETSGSCLMTMTVNDRGRARFRKQDVSVPKLYGVHMRASNFVRGFLFAVITASAVTAHAAEPQALVWTVADASSLPIRTAAIQPPLLTDGPHLGHSRHAEMVIPAAPSSVPGSYTPNYVPAVTATANVQAEPRRSAADFLLLSLVGVALVGYQLLRKHRLLRPQPFSL
jgi:hypothetical protein